MPQCAFGKLAFAHVCASVHPRAPHLSGCREGVQHASMTFTCKMNEGTATVVTCVTTHDMHRCAHAHLCMTLLFFYFSIRVCMMSLRIVITLTLFMQLCPAVFMHLTVCAVHKQSRGVHNSCLYVWGLLYAQFLRIPPRPSPARTLCYSVLSADARRHQEMHLFKTCQLSCWCSNSKTNVMAKNKTHVL